MTDVPTEVKQPEDHKAPTVPAEPFVWTAPDGKTVTLKPFTSLPVGIFRKARAEGDEMNQTFALLEAATDEAGLEVIDNLQIGDLNTVFEDWAAASGVEAPES
jgi:hypothetical protein